MGGWGNEESFSDYTTVLYAGMNWIIIDALAIVVKHFSRSNDITLVDVKQVKMSLPENINLRWRSPVLLLWILPNETICECLMALVFLLHQRVSKICFNSSIFGRAWLSLTQLNDTHDMYLRHVKDVSIYRVLHAVRRPQRRRVQPHFVLQL